MKKNWKPINKQGIITDKYFDKRFIIDRTFIYDNLLFEYKIRFVKHLITENDKITVYKHKTFKYSKPFLQSKYLSWLFHSEKIQLLSTTDIFKKYKYKL